MNCYFCNDKHHDKIVVLNNGLSVGACWSCFEIVDNSVKKQIVIGGEKMSNEQLNLSDYGNIGQGGSKSLKKIDGKFFTIVGIEDHAFDGQMNTIITTKEEFDVDGNKVNRFYTTRQAVMNQLSNPKLREAIRNGGTLRVKCTETKGEKGRKYFVLTE